MKKLSILLVLVAVLGMLGIYVTAAAVQVDVQTPSTSETGTITVSVPAEEPTVSGQITISYDNRVLTFVDAAIEAEMYSIHTQSSSVSILYSNLKAARAEAAFTFTYDDTTAGKSVVSVTTEGFAEGRDEAVISTTQTTLTLPAKTHICPAAVFTDVDTSKWYHEAIDYVLDEGLMFGVSDTLFAPDSTTTRAMFVTVLGRIAGIDSAAYDAQADFTDVEAGKWFAPYVKWASENGIVLGYPDGTFAPDAAISRQEMISMLYRFARFQNTATAKGDSAVLDAFADADSVADWAKEAMAWAVEAGILNGTEKGLEPNGTATRAQLAQILMKYCQETD